MNEFTKQCPSCGKLINCKTKYYLKESKRKNRNCQSCAAKERIKKYGNNDSFNKISKKGAQSGELNPFYGKKHSDDARKKISENTNREWMNTAEYKAKVSKQCSGKGNPMYGKICYQIWLEKYGKEEADRRKEARRQKASKSLSGANNPMYGKPSPQGSGNGWNGWYKDWFFRSLLELSYVVNVLEKQNKKWVSAEYIKIPYESYDGHQRTYRPDFLVDSHLLIEIKPAKLVNTRLVQIKKQAAIQYAKQKDMDYQIISPQMISKSNLIQLHQDGQFKFTEKYEEKFIQYYR